MNSEWSRVASLATLCLIAGLQLGCKGTQTSHGLAQAQDHSSPAHGWSAGYDVAPGTRGIETIAIKPEPIPDYLNVPAQIQADPTLVVHVFTPAGGRITAMKVRPWDHVVKGQTLATLYSNDLARAVADYHKALVDHRVKQEALARATYLFAHSAIARKDLQQAQGDAAMAEAEVKATRAQIQVFGMNPDEAANQLSVVAPRSGVILDVGASQGEFSNGLSAPQPLCTIADLETVWAVGELLERDLYLVKAGEAAELTVVSYPGETWRGHVDLISSAVDPVTRTLRLRVVLPNLDRRLRPGMYGTLRIVRTERLGVAVPNAAVLREGTAAFVFVEQSPRQYIRRAITLGQQIEGNRVEVTGGLHFGERVVADGTDLLRAAANAQ